MPWQHMHSLLFQSTLPREERHMTVQLHPHRRRFQSTLPREERPSLYLLGAHLHNFNPRSHERSDGYGPDDRETIRHFNPRSHERSDNVRMADLEKDLDFNPRSHERSDAAPGVATNFHVDFNPRSHERSDGGSFRLLSLLPHFNPRSHERSDPGAAGGKVKYMNFNPRSHERSDRSLRQFRRRAYISIHAPTRGATQLCNLYIINNRISIHAPTRGATHQRCARYFPKLFQSTLPREERHNVCGYKAHNLYFNPRSHERSDFMPSQACRQFPISIHAPTRGATRSSSNFRCNF